MPAQQQRNAAADSHTALIGIGANIGDPQDQVNSAIATIARLPHTVVMRSSSLYRSAPVGKTDQPDFINATALITTGLEPEDLLSALFEIEHNHGRVRSVRNGPRTLDLDLLLYDDRVIDTPGLCVPHPRMHERRFVLEPTLEIAPDCVIPGRGLARELLALIRDQPVERLPW